MLIVFTVILGVGYPLVITLIAQIPGLKDRADGSLISADGKTAGSSLIGQSFTDSDGNPLVQYFQSRPSAAGDGYDPTATSASNLGPESIVDTLPDPSVDGDTGTQSLLTQVCQRSLAVGALDGVDGSRPFCATVKTTDGSGEEAIGSVLAVFYAGPGYSGAVTRVVAINESSDYEPFIQTYDGVKVETATFGDDYSKGQIVPIRGDAPSDPAVPSDAVTASGSGLDPQISPAYAKIQIARVAQARGVSAQQVQTLVSKYTDGRDLGFLGEPRVNVLKLNIALDAAYPFSG
jgi:K+-transporting ATPase ATPase C chain